jgi:hypothetical protein
VGTAAFAVAGLCVASPAKADVDVKQEVLKAVIQNILQSVRDQIQGRRLRMVPGMNRFSSEDSEFDNKDPFAAKGMANPFDAALGYTKAPPMAAPPASDWLFGVNAVGSGDRSYALNTWVSSATGVGAFDATKIGIFTATDALTFVLTGSDTWAHTFSGFGFDSNTPAASGTISYINGGFSTDFTATASWTTNSSTAGLLFAPPANSSSMSYTWNAQYRFDFQYGVFIEPTGGVTYTDLYTANFGTHIGNSTEVHLGGRIGTEMKWMGFTVQPQLSGAVFKLVDVSGAAAGGGIAGVPAVPVVPAPIAVSDTGLGGRGSAKINVIWTPNFSTYVEGHGMGIAGTKTLGFVATESIGGQVGARYTW